ncbi:MAG: dicarboxylate/amino acid:cation symporter [Deltaproteobacteria bacterium]|nr:dicarboxylate/amino acid:cation symporter [Deltaproteobacteria bacterium]
MKFRAPGLYVQVLIAVIVGVLVGVLAPEFGATLKPLGEAFIKCVKMLIAPIVFCTVVTGIAKMGDLKKVGRVGVKALVWFELMTTLALVIGLLVGRFVQPGAGMNVDASKLDMKAIESYAAQGKALSGLEFAMNVIPRDVVDAFAKGDILQVLFFALLFGLALAHLPEKGAPMLHWLESAGDVLFKIVGLVMKVAPLGAFGAMAFTVGKYGVGTLLSLGKLMACFYLTSVLFVVIVLGLVLRWTGAGLVPFLLYIREEIFIVLGTSSSESALPPMMKKLEQLGCGKGVVGLVVPMGYSFNLDGTSIYLTLATLFIAQATGTHVTLAQELQILAVLLLTSKGAAAVTGSGFITLAATLSSVGSIPVAGLTLLIGIDRFMSEARAITNLIGNGVATVVVARWEGELDVPRMREVLGAKAHAPAEVAGAA